MRFNPLYLALGRLHFGIAFDGPDGAGSGVVESGLSSYLALKDATMDVAIENVPRDLNLSGRLTLNSLSLVLDGQQCRSAEGEVSTDILARNSTTLGWDGPVLAGSIACRDGALYIPIAGNRDGEAVDIEASLFGDHRYEAKVAVTTSNPRLLQALPAFGFSEEAMNLLREALAQGVSYTRLHPDMDLEPLWDYPPFQELLKPKG